MIESFRKIYGSADGVRFFRAPGRVNLIGEHTDYNLGFVLPVALQLATYVAAAPVTDGRIRIYTEDRAEMREFDASTIKDQRPTHEWSDYPIGVARELALLGIPMEGANLLIRSTVPEGSGLSSSAAIEVSSALAFLRGREIGKLELAKLCQRAEREFVGVPCGIMDQYISVFGQERAAVEIDCRALTHRLVTLPAEIAFVATNTMVKHALAATAYKERVAECAAAVAALKADNPGIESLRDVTLQQLQSHAAKLPAVVFRRARHIVTESARVRSFVEAGARGNLREMGRLMVESHRSLQHDYEVSCKELDFLVDHALPLQGVYGSRMTGGGFGGCTVTMLQPDALAAFQKQIAKPYAERFGKTPEFHECVPSEGAGEITNPETIPVVEA